VNKTLLSSLIASISAAIPLSAIASDNPPQNDSSLEQVDVTGRQINLIGEAQSASQGLVSQREISVRPLLRTGEVLELVPGMVVTQHSGTGKANQYFLRGFNLDHGTDFATFVDGMPVNMRSHGHGQGYTDLNFIIPETIDTLTYKKGAYYADVGDFSGAGSAALQTASRLENGELAITLGQNDYQRLLLADSVEAYGGEWLYAIERNTYDGPWKDISEDLDKTNLLLKHTRPTDNGELTFTLMAYNSSWNSADQIPARAVDQNQIDELGSLDNTTGGESSRYSFSSHWQGHNWQWSAYAIQYDMNLWSNFTYFLDDPLNGDQFEQVDKRWIYGGNTRYNIEGEVGGLAMSNLFGAELRYDDIEEVGLYKTKNQQRLGTVRSDSINELSVSVHWENQLQWSENIKTVLGVRHDYFDFDVDNQIDTNINGVNLHANSGSNNDQITSFKASIIYTLNEQWEAYASAGEGFHSNDARGTTISVDPADGSAVNTVDPLVSSLGYEFGLRGFINQQLNTSISFWQLELDSELLFVGDAGNTEASRKSKRTGIELTAYYRLNDNWNLDLEYAYTDARFIDSAEADDEIPGAIEQVWQAGINANFENGWFGSFQIRYFGERPLEESGQITSDSSTLANLQVGHKTGPWTIKADVLNLFDSDDHDIDYYYASLLPSETAPETEDIHYHVLEPRTLRVSASYNF
jgi:outer membrane cobalamin receptor